MVCAGSSGIHIKAIVDGILEKLRDGGVGKPRIEGYVEAKWVLIDSEDVVAHVFAQEEREFYDLETMWRGVERALETERPAAKRRR